MYRLLLIATLLFSFTIGFICTGCGDSGTTNVLPVKTPTPGGTAKVPLPDPDLKMVGEEEGGFFSPVIDLITDGLKEGVTSWIGANTTGRVLDTIGNKIGISNNSDITNQLNEMNQKMDFMIDQLNDIQTELTTLQTELALDAKTLEAYVEGETLQTYITDIKSKFGINYTGSDDSSFMYYSYKGSLLDPNNMDPNSTDVITLKNQTANYVDKNYGLLEKDIMGIHDGICPDGTVLNGILKDYTDELILKQSGNQYLTDPNNAMETYKVLESYFAMLLNYQTKALIIVTELNNYSDPSGSDAGIYLNGTYKQLLKEEIVKYEQTVNYLVINLIDYRNPTNYHNDAGYMYTQGIAPDNVYLMILARSRFFCAQVLNALENDCGLYGAIVTPYYSSSDPNTAGTQATLQFSGPVSFTKTVKAQKMAGQFLYTRWLKKDSSSDNQCACDNNWSFYDFSTLQNPNISGDYFDPNIPAGTYSVTLVDNGDEDTPWYHNTVYTNLGQVSVKYYDPNNPSPGTATFSPTDTNTLKFGYFSSRWNWGYNSINLCPDFSNWSVPSSNEIRWPGSSKTQKEDNPTIYPKSLDEADYFPKKSSSFDYLNYMGISLDTDNAGSQTAVMYTINYPFIADQPSGTFLVPPSATVFYDTSADVDYSNSKPSTSDYSYDLLYFDYYIIDRDKSNTYNMYNYSSENNFNLDTSDAKYGTYDNTLVFARKYYVSIDAGSSTEENKYSGVSVEADVNLNWNIQVIYNGTVNIFQ